MKSKQNIQKKRNDERKRRAIQTQLIDEIGSLVPFISRSDAKLSKNESLKLATGYIKFMHAFRDLDVTPFISDLNHRLSQSTDDRSYVICDGALTVIFSSEDALKELGYKEYDIYGCKLTSLIHEEDIKEVMNATSNYKDAIIKPTELDKQDFCINFRVYEKKNIRNQFRKFQLVRFEGKIEFFKQLLARKGGIKNAKNDDPINYDPAILIRGSIDVIKGSSLSSQTNYRFTNKNQYHLLMRLDGTILYADHRIVNVIGFQPLDVIGKSAYSYICPDDQAMSLYLHTKTLRSNDGVGEVVHRLRAINNTYVYINSAGKLEYDDTTILFHVLATALSEEQGEKIRRETVKLLTPYCGNKTTAEFKYRVDEIANSKLAALKKDENHGAGHPSQIKNCVDFKRTDEAPFPNISPFPSSPTICGINSSGQNVVGQYVENEFIHISASPLTYQTSLPEQLYFTSQHDSSIFSSPHSLPLASTQELMQSQLCSSLSTPESMPSTSSSSNRFNPEIMGLSNEARFEARSMATNEIFFADQHGTGSFEETFAEQNTISPNSGPNYNFQIADINN
ncbi:aryl hydrocarbon receptor nuclear translocator homolog [Tetranychus urticae]|uniref:BHLH domain-containing protein n=1 Tax=Tetranychus urticae TaxID=32264 RepID=T1KPV7_TETUR|nr:aryl hydrocarbon receptor nuclear translocator homolog [Tetranychus urticae]